MRRAARKDANHDEVAEALFKAGHTVVGTYQQGNGFPDIVSGKGGVTWMWEVKAKDGELTPAQVEFITRWRGGPLHVVKSGLEALRIAGDVASTRVAQGPKRTGPKGDAEKARIDNVFKEIRGGKG